MENVFGFHKATCYTQKNDARVRWGKGGGGGGGGGGVRKEKQPLTGIRLLYGTSNAG